jgi:hypothetical protein
MLCVEHSHELHAVNLFVQFMGAYDAVTIIPDFSNMALREDGRGQGGLVSRLVGGQFP